jgi:chromosome condensin MukBEF ATPase and DNA-binding subunit MukB
VVRNHVPADVVDATGEDYLIEMQRKRDLLVQELKGYEGEMREYASSVYEAISSKIREQVAQVKRMSKLAENLQFGNVVGMRVTAERKEYLLELLQAFSTQGSLFGAGDHDQPFEQVLTNYFTAALNAKVNGEQLLDYRSYMDIRIEVLRSWDAGKWHPSSSLSGGEAIGGGLAITLILFRSLASRGGGVNNIPPAQITTTFVIDEMMRLDDKGQDVAVKFGEQQGFQMLVTAPKLSPDYRCTLWSIDLSLVDGKPNVVIRGVRRDAALAA